MSKFFSYRFSLEKLFQGQNLRLLKNFTVVDMSQMWVVAISLHTVDYEQHFDVYNEEWPLTL